MGNTGVRPAQSHGHAEHGLVELDSVTIEGAEFNPSVEVGFCQVADDGTFTHDQRDCGTPFGLTTTSPAGDFSAQHTVRRFIRDEIPQRTVDCAVESCAIAAAETSDIPGTLVLTPIAFAPAPPPPATHGSITVTPQNPVQRAASDRRRHRLPAERQDRDPPMRRRSPEHPRRLRPELHDRGRRRRRRVQRIICRAAIRLRPAGRVECDSPGICVIAAAEVVDIPGTIVTAPLDIAALQPDGRIRAGVTGSSPATTSTTSTRTARQGSGGAHRVPHGRSQFSSKTTVRSPTTSRLRHRQARRRSPFDTSSLTSTSRRR